MTASPLAQVRRWLGNASLQRRFAFTLAALSVLSGIATVAMMTDAGALTERIKELRWMLIIDGVMLMMLIVIVARRLILLWRERQLGLAGAGLQGKLVMLFAIIAVTPALLVAVFSYLFLNFGLEAWFNKRVTSALEESVGVTEAYLKEHRENIANQAYSVAYVLNQNAPRLMRNPWEFNRVLSANAASRELPEAVVIDRLGNILARSDFALSTVIEEVPKEAFEQADNGEVTLLGSEKVDKVRALVRLTRFVEAYLLVERFVDPRVLQHINGIRQAFDEYNQLEATRSGVQISFVVIYMIAVMILLLAAIWIGMTVSAQMAAPVTSLIGAAERISKGDLSARVESNQSRDEIGVLSRVFNNMASRISTQQQGLMVANSELDERRRFTETVLAGVSAGVIGLSAEKHLDLPNRSASELLGIDLETHIGERFSDVIPELSDLLDAAENRPERMQQSEVSIKVGDAQKTFLVRVAAEHKENSITGFVVTFDDVTALLSAQRKAAWADVARRIAHEIKNPLTPIQLSAERLNRKYLKEIESDPETFKKCIETIIRQVGDIGRMVDEFSSFARMPLPDIRPANLSELCRQAVFLERNRGIDTAIELDLPQTDITIACDSRQVSRVLTNIIKNAVESIDGAREDGMDGVQGCVRLTLQRHATDDLIDIIVEDDGRGLPVAERERLTEPYVTTRVKGTGLGLAIVKKIMEEHGGTLLLADNEPRGARVTLRFPIGDVDRDDDSNSGHDNHPSRGDTSPVARASKTG